MATTSPLTIGGALHQYGKFVGWNGHICESKLSHEILNEALLLPNNKTVLPKAAYTNDHKDFKEATLSFSTLDDISRCIIIRPTLIKMNPYRL